MFIFVGPGGALGAGAAGGAGAGTGAGTGAGGKVKLVLLGIESRKGQSLWFICFAGVPSGARSKPDKYDEGPSFVIRSDDDEEDVEDDEDDLFLLLLRRCRTYTWPWHRHSSRRR